MTEKQGAALISLLSMLILIVLGQAGARALIEQTWEYRALEGEGQASEGAYECIFKRRKSLLTNLGLWEIPVATP